MPISVNQSGVWKDVQELFINNSGTWVSCLDVLVNDNGTWKSAMLYRIPSSGSITQYFGLSYQYGNPSILTWTRSGGTFNFTISSATTYCGSTYGYSGSVAITTTTYNGVPTETASFTNNHPKDCCNGNQNYIWENYTITMVSPTSALLTASSYNGSQSGC